MPRPNAGFVVAAVLGALLWAQPAAGQRYEEETPIPPGAKGEVLELKGDVRTLKGEVLEIKGLASGLAARVDPLQAALRDLGATVREKEIKISLSADVLFDFDKADLRPEAGPSLAKVAAVLKAHPKAATLIEGHTDGKGTDKYNQPLSERRAEAVRRWLAANGIGARMTTRGWGKAKPVAPNTKPNGADDPDGRQKNRRVEITVKTQ
jgi:outer membrane protein OmpA-like peptidoglycan-associated protein